MKSLFLVPAAILLSACASNTPVRSESVTISATLKIPYEKAWQNTLQVLQAQGFTIDASNKKGGVISVGETLVKLNERQADCGNFHGISYLKDYRTSTYLSLDIDLEKKSDKATTIRINSFLKAFFINGIGAETISLSCYSLGNLEKNLLARIED